MASSTIRINTLLYYAAHILSGASFIIPITVLYYLSRGLQFFEIGLLGSVFLFTSLLLEIPTGVLADRVGRKIVSVSGFFLIGLGTIFIGIGNSFEFFMLAQVIFGIGAALRSGADTSLLYDSLREQNAENLYSKIEGKSYALFSVAGVIAAPMGAYLFSWNNRLPFFLDGFLLFLAALAYALMHESKNQSKAKEQVNYIQAFTVGLQQLIRSANIRQMMFSLILVSLILSTFGGLISQPFLIDRGFDVTHIGYLFAVALLMQSFGSFYAHKFNHYWSARTNVAAIIFLLGVFLLTMTLPLLAILLLSYLSFSLIKGFQYPILKTYFQALLPPPFRATILSTQNTLENLIGMLFFPIAGLAIDKMGVTESMTIFGVMISIAGLAIFLTGRKPTTL